MKGGIVATIRVNPKDCQSVLDVLAKAGVRTDGMSFAAITSLALSSLLEAARQDAIIPEPDAYQYLNRLGPHIKTKHGRKLQITAVLHNEGARLQAPPVTASVPTPEELDAAEAAASSKAAPKAQKAPAYTPEPEDDNSEEVRFAQNRLTELLAKKDAIDSGTPGLQWTEHDTAEFTKVYQIVYPDG